MDPAMTSSPEYRHSVCGAVVPATDVRINAFDARWADGPCRHCRGKGPWRRVDATETKAVERAKAEEGMEVARGNTIPWQVRATQWVEALPPGTRVVSDDVTSALGVPISQGAVGALFSSLRAKKVLRFDGIDTSGRAGRHASMIRVWTRL